MLVQRSSDPVGLLEQEVKNVRVVDRLRAQLTDSERLENIELLVEARFNLVGEPTDDESMARYVSERT